MNECTLPCSPNWFLSSVSSGNRAGLFAFGSRNDVFVYDVSSTTSSVQAHGLGIAQQETISNPVPKLVACYTEHTEKITSVCLSPDSEQWICCSSDEKSVRLWDIRSLVTVQVHTEHKNKITCMTWSPSNLDLVVTASEKGALVLWRLQNNTVKSCCPEKEYICCVKASPHSQSQIAIGYRTGVVLIIDIKEDQPRILHRLRGHEGEITSLCWCPVKGERLLCEDRTGEGDVGSLLATAGRRLIKVWSTSKCKEVWFQKLPQGQVFKQDSQDPMGRKIWLDICWPAEKPDCLISSSSGPQGDLLMWNLRVKAHQDPQHFDSKGITKHSRLIFNVAAAADKICTFSLDRTIAVWDLKSLRGVTSWNSFGGYVYCARASPLDPGVIAIGAGDNTIRIWNQNNKSNPFDISCLFYGLRSKVTSVSWHPEKEGLLAYGTEDGRVGVFSTLSTKPPAMSATFHNKTVYVVCWGPPIYADTDNHKYQVYSVGDGIILQHFIGESKDKRPAVSLTDIIASVNGVEGGKMIQSEMTWRRDHTAFAIGNDNGSVSVYSFPSLKRICSISIHQKLINCVRWHPDTTAESVHSSPCRNWVAIAGNGRHISIVDLSTLFVKSHAQASTPSTITHASCQLPGHVPRTTDICWSPHQDGMLVSVGYDNVAIVWNVKTSEALVRYDQHTGRLLTVLWSSLDSDLIMTGGFDSTFRIWKVSAQPRAVISSEGTKKKHKRKTTSTAAVASSLDSVANGSEVVASEQEIQELQDLLMLKQRQLMCQAEIEKTTESGASGSVSQKPDSDTPAHSYVILNKSVPDEPLASSSLIESATGSSLSSSAERGQPPVTAADLSLSCKASVEISGGGGENNESNVNGEAVIPTVADLVPPVRPLFSRSGLDNQGNRVTPPVKDASATDTLDKSRKRKVKPKSFFPVLSTANNQGKAAVHKDIIDLAKIVSGQGAGDLVDSKPHLGIFTDRLGAHRCLLQESEYHLSHDNMEYHLQQELWRGNVAGAIQIARQRNELSDWVVAMAPLASHDLWELVSAEYAEQLEEEGQYHKAATYLLAAHKVHQAIDLFRRHRLFKEAVSLAKIRLSPIDPLLEDLYTEWGQNLMKDGQFEQAAKCYLAMRHIQEAGKTLARRQDHSSLKTACQMSLVSSETQQGLAYAYKVFTNNLIMGEWQEAYAFVGEHESLQVFLPFLSTHELLVQHLGSLCPSLGLTKTPVTPELFSQWEKKEIPKDKIKLPEFLLDKLEVDPVIPWEPYLLGEHTFPHHVLRVWHQHLGITMVTHELKTMHTAISQLASLRQNVADLPNTLFLVSVDVTLCLLALLASETSSAITHLVQAVSLLHQGNHKSLLQAFCRLMLPIGAKYLLKLQQEFNAARVLITMEKHGDVDKASGESHNALKKFLSDIREDNSISMSSMRCRELDCLRAYYYLAVLDFIRDSYPSTQPENDSIDGMPNGCHTKIPSWKECKTVDGVNVTSVPKSDDRSVIINPKTNGLDAEECNTCEVNDMKDMADMDQNGKLNCSSSNFSHLSTCEYVAVHGDMLSLDDESPRSGKTSCDTNATCDDENSKMSSMGDTRSQSSLPPPDAGEFSTSLSPLHTTSSLSTPIVNLSKASSESPSFDPPCVPSSVPKVLTVPSKNGTSINSLPPLNTLIRHSENAGHFSEKSPESAKTSGKDSHTEARAPVISQTIIPQGHLNYNNLLKLSKGILWDVQAKKEALTETLGYIHRAISQHLLANRTAGSSALSSRSSKQDYCSSPSISISTAVFPQSPQGDLEEDGSCHKTRLFKSLSSSELQMSSGISSESTVKTLNDKDEDSKKSAGSTKDGGICLSPQPTAQVNEFAIRRPQRSWSESYSTVKSPSGLLQEVDHAIPLQIEQELLGAMAGEPIGAQKSRKVLWMDGKETGSVDVDPDGMTAFQVSKKAPDGSTIPLEWDDLPVDVKYIQPYVTLPLLRQEQENISQELKRVPESLRLPFPKTESCIRRLLDTSLNSSDLMKMEKLSYFKQLNDWATLFAVTTHQQSEMEALFNLAAAEHLTDDKCSM